MSCLLEALRDVAFPVMGPLGLGSPPSSVLCDATTALWPSQGPARVARSPIPCVLRAVCGVPAGLVGWSKRRSPGLVVTRSPSPGVASRRQMALPRSRVPPMQTCPALRPRWCPAHAPYCAQNCCLPMPGNCRLSHHVHVSGLHHTACLLAPPGFVRPFTGRHAGSLLTCWLDFHQVGLEPYGAHPLGNTNQFHRFAPTPKVSGLPWRDHAFVRRRLACSWAGRLARFFCLRTGQRRCVPLAGISG